MPAVKPSSQWTLCWREMDSNPLPFARNPAFLRLLHPRSQPICTPILLPLHPFRQRNCVAARFWSKDRCRSSRHGFQASFRGGFERLRRGRKGRFVERCKQRDASHFGIEVIAEPVLKVCSASNERHEQ